ncbi:MAG TPA: ABC transporter ATP-binding protein [Polyangiaceae bacterium]|nr:ABC transporter ATP-binding protein [Polyangiaceae bacterium]
MTSLRLESVSVAVGGRTLLDAVSIELEAGRFLALVGPNGAGKTTLLRAALGLVPTSAGRVIVGNQPLHALSPRARAAEVAWLPQQPLPMESVPAREAVMAARFRFSETAAATRRAAEQALERVGLAERASSPLTELSGGERQRIAIAALLAQEARFLLLDEPANHLDPAQQGDTYALLGRLLETGIGILCVTHDVNLLNHTGGAPQVAGLRGGKLVFTRSFEAPELPAELGALFGVRMLSLAANHARLIVPAPPEPQGGIG